MALPTPFDSQYNAIRAQIEAVANRYGINPKIAVWQLWQENKFRSSGCSGKAACGIAQFIPATAARFGVDRNNVASSLEGYGKYMQFLLNLFKGNYQLALAGYNAGEGAVKKYNNTIPPFRETQNYVREILTNANGATGNAGTPPNPDDSQAIATAGLIGGVGILLLAYFLISE